MVMQRTGPLADAAIAAFQTALRFPPRLFGAEGQIDFAKVLFTRISRQFIRLAARGRGRHLTGLIARG